MAVGTLLGVRAGDQIPLDAEVVSGSAAVDESAVTGEAAPLSKGPGDSVTAGTIVQNGFMEVRTTGTASESTVASIQVWNYSAPHDSMTHCDGVSCHLVLCRVAALWCGLLCCVVLWCGVVYRVVLCCVML